jgi:hypothetical protein
MQWTGLEQNSNSSDVQSMQKYFMSKLYLRETTLFLQGCMTILTVFVTARLLWA